MYEIAIYRKRDGVPVVDIDIARAAVEGTNIKVVEPGGVDGNWLAELPRKLAYALVSFGYVEAETSGFEIRGEWSE
jgi:hypothetical protein